MAGVDRLHPVQRRRGIADFANAAVIAALAAANAAEIEPHDRTTEALEGLIHRICDAIIHGPAVERVRMEDERDRRPRLLGMMITTF